MTLTDKLKVQLRNIGNFLIYWYDWLVLKFLIFEDNDQRRKKYKRDHLELFFSGRMLLKFNKVYANVDSRFTPNKEQRMFIEGLVMAHNYNNTELMVINNFTKRLDIRPATANKFKKLAVNKNTKKLSNSLEGLDILYPEYVAMIRVAEGTMQFQETYEYILEDLQDRIARKKAFRSMMLFPASAVISILGMEVFVTLFLLPEITVALGTSDFSQTPTLSSYVELREIFLTRKMEYFLKIFPWVIAFLLFLRLRGTKYLIDLLLIQMPGVKKIVIQWEVSKFFNSLRGLVKTRFSVKETVNKSVDVISNRVIKMSLKRDIAENSGNSPHYYDMFHSSVYLEPHILNQLKIAKENGSNAEDVLENVYLEYKDAMKNVMEQPAQLVMPAFSILLSIYIAVRLLPIYTEINLLADLMSRG